MEKEDFIRKLNSVGKRAFVENFDIFERYSSGRISKEQARAALVALGVSNDAGANIRLGNAKLIFRRGWKRRLFLLCLPQKMLILPYVPRPSD